LFCLTYLASKSAIIRHFGSPIESFLVVSTSKLPTYNYKILEKQLIMDANNSHEATDPVSDGVSEAWPAKIVLGTYPNQAGVHPAPMDWGNPDPELRGPVVVSRQKSTVGRRNGKY
jgi:GTP cyclohydrolase I-like protein